MDETEELRAWGVPDALEEFAGWDPNPRVGEPIPIVWLPEDWTPNAEPSLSEVQAGVSAGMGIMVANTPSQPFDLAWLGEAASSLRLLWCPHDPKALKNIELLERMHALHTLRGPLTQERVDLSRSPDLQVVSVKGEGLLTALAAPALRHAVVELTTPFAKVELSSTIESLAITSPSVDMVELVKNLPVLTSLTIEGADVVTLQPLAQLTRLTELKLMNCGRMDSTSALSEVGSLRRLTLDRVAAVEDPFSLLSLRLDWMHAYHCPDLGEEFRLSAGRLSDGWVVQPKRSRVSRSRFAMSRASDGSTELQFTDWRWLEDALYPGVSGQSLTSRDLERMLDVPQSRGAGQVEFDSEGDTFIAIFATRAEATRMRRVWDIAISDLAKAARSGG